MNLRIAKTFQHNVPMPKQQTKTSAGYDLCSVESVIRIWPGEQKVVGTGYAFEIPWGFAGFIWPRSGLAVKNGIHVMAGLIDSDYRGEIKVCLRNFSEEEFVINQGDRIAQLVISPVLHWSTELVESLDETDRGSGGFGSTGQ